MSETGLVAAGWLGQGLSCLGILALREQVKKYMLKQAVGVIRLVNRDLEVKREGEHAGLLQIVAKRSGTSGCSPIPRARTGTSD